MGIKAEKLSLIRAILDIEDVHLINEIKKIIERRTYDWFDDLTEDQQKSVLRGLEQGEGSYTITHEEAIARLGL